MPVGNGDNVLPLIPLELLLNHSWYPETSFDKQTLILNILVIPNTTGRNGTKSAIGIYFSYASTENRPIYVSGGHPSDNVNPGVACLKELAEIFAGKEGIRTGVEVLHRMKIKSSKMIIKTPSATFVNMMTQQSNFNHWADNNANVHSVLFNEAKEQVKRARTLGYEVVFWLATPPETSHAVELAYHALATFVPLAIA